MKYAIWIAMGLVSIVMLMGGFMKLTGNPLALKSFADLGLSNTFALFIGVCEIAGAIGLWLRPTSRYAALGIAGIMIGAVYYHFNYTPLSEGAPAMIVLALSLFIATRQNTGVVG